MIGIDADYAVSQAYRSQGWPSFLVVDPEGVVRFHAPPTDRELTSLRKCLDQLLAQKPATTGEKPAMHRGIALPTEVLASWQARRDRSPRLAFDRVGNPLLVYYSNREGTNAVFLRRFNSKGEAQEDRRLSSPGVESYAADCAADATGNLWVTWCGRQKGRYDIYVQSLPAQGDPVTEHFKSNLDDAMSPRIATGPDGAIAVVCYFWHALRGVSRDRDVFAFTFDPTRHAWRPQLEVSPHAPEVEDHSDPDVTFDPQGRAWVAWSYDYHPQLFKQPVDASQPTIFAAQVKSSDAVSAPIFAGATGKLRDAVDLFPSAVVDGQGKLWCAWDCSEPRRAIRLVQYEEAGNRFKEANVFGGAGEVCSTPELSAAGTNGLLLAWSSRAEGERWRGRVAFLKGGQATADTVISESVNVLFPQAQKAPNGEYWVTYEKCGPIGSEVVLRNVSAELGSGGQTPAATQQRP